MKLSRAFDGIKKVSNINTYQVNCKQVNKNLYCELVFNGTFLYIYQVKYQM